MEDYNHPPGTPDGQPTRDGHRTSLLPDADAENHAETDHFRFYVSDLLILTFSIAVGFAGGHWISPELFTFVLGCITFAGMIVTLFYPPTMRFTYVLWIALFAAYAASVAALVRK